MSIEREPPSSEPAPADVVWVVDDSPLQAERARSSLRNREVRVFPGATGMLECLSLGVRPDVLLLDWNMPDVSGLEACRCVRQLADETMLPIVILTASDDPEDLLEALAAGANDFLRKPVMPVELDARVSALVRSKRVNEKLRATEIALRAEASFREEFLAILAHDLRQPLNVFALGSNALGAEGMTPIARQRVAKQLLRASERMQRMIGELLDFSRARPRGRMPTSPREVDLTRIVTDVVDEIRLAHGDQVIELACPDGCVGTWDADRLAQVVSNLVENAITYRAPATAVRVTLACNRGRATLAVENEGEPIPPALLPQLFDAFRRGARPGPKAGLGLGLYIAAQIVEAHGGSIEVRSTASSTRFEVSLPQAAGEPAGEDAPPRSF